MKKKRIIIISAVTVVIAVIIVVAMKYRKNHRQIINNNKLDNVWVTQFYKFETDDLLDKNMIWKELMIVKVPIYLRLSVPKIQNLIIRPVQNMDRWKRYSRAMGNSKRAIIL